MDVRKQESTSIEAISTAMEIGKAIEAKDVLEGKLEKEGCPRCRHTASIATRYSVAFGALSSLYEQRENYLLAQIRGMQCVIDVAQGVMEEASKK